MTVTRAVDVLRRLGAATLCIAGALHVQANGAYPAPHVVQPGSETWRRTAATGGAVRSDTTETTLPSLDNVRTLAVYRLGHLSDTTPTRAGIEDMIAVRVSDLWSLVRRARCVDAHDRDVTPCQKRDIALFLDGREIKGIIPESGAPRAERNILQFHLKRSAESDEAWADLLGAPRRGYFLYRPTAVSVGLAGDYELPTDVDGRRFELIRARKAWLAGSSAVLAVLFGILVWAAMQTSLLRDRGDVPAGDRRGWPSRSRQSLLGPYSLARVQMAFWFALVLASYAFIWLVTNASDTITPSVLGLIGIGVGTALGAAAIDAGKQTGNAAELDALRVEEKTVAAEVAALTTYVTAVPPPADALAQQQVLAARKARLDVLQAADGPIARLVKATQPQKSEGFLRDVLNDANGSSFHRLQIFAWTLVLGVLFVHSVWARLSMPEFSGTLLALMGISSGTYLGFKIPEKPS